LKETRPLWPPQRGVGLREPNLGKTNPRVTLFIACDLFCALSRGLVYISNANPACSCVYICKFQFRPIHPPPLGDYQVPLVVTVVVQLIVVMHILHSQIPLFNKCQMMLTKVCYLLFLPPVKSTLKPYHLKNTKKLQMIDVTKSTRIIEFVYCKLTCVAP
jgi:hypothetical protein